MEFSITQEGAFSPAKLGDFIWFKKCLAYELIDIANRYHCNITLSSSELLSVFDSYLDDVDRTLLKNTDDETNTLDHFKHSAFLCFWTRRMRPIKSIQFQSEYEICANEPDCDIEKVSARQTMFAAYANEICALELALLICLHFETERRECIQNDGDVLKILPDDGIPFIVSAPFFKEIVSILKKKNNSPYSIYMLLKSIFTR